MNVNSTEKPLDAHQVSDFLGIAYQTVLDNIHLGKLKAYKIGKHYRIFSHDLKDFIKDCEVKSYWQGKNI